MELCCVVPLCVNERLFLFAAGFINPGNKLCSGYWNCDSVFYVDSGTVEKNFLCVNFVPLCED